MSGLECQGNLDRKIWGVAPMTLEGMYPGTSPIGGAIRYSAISPVPKAFSVIIRAELSCTVRIREAL
jgi:hypothetical protein